MKTPVDEAIERLANEADDYITIRKSRLKSFWEGGWGLGYEEGLKDGRKETVEVRTTDEHGRTIISRYTKDSAAYRTN